MRGQNPQNRAYGADVTDALNAVDVIVGRQFPRPFFRKVQGVGEFFRHGIGEPVIAVVAGRVFRKSRVRCVADPFFNRNHVAGEGTGGNIRPWRKFPAVFIKANRSDHALRRVRYHFIRALQIVVTVGRLVDRVGVNRLVA